MATNDVDETQNDQLIPVPKSIFSKLNITVEPIFFSLFFCASITDAAGTNLLLTRTCTMVFGFSYANCTNEIPASIQDTIQPYTAKIVMGKALTATIFPSILSLYIGSWTDISKERKPFLILPLIGLTIGYVIWVIMICFPIPPIYFLLTALPYSITGGTVSLFTCGYCYLSDVTNEGNRAFRMSLLTIALTLGMLSGYLVSTEMFKAFHKDVYLIIFGTSLCWMILIVLYAIFILPDTKIFTEENENSEARRNIKNLFNLSHIKDSVTVLIKERPSNGRLILLLLIAIIVIDILVFEGETNLRYLSLKASFNWTAEDYNVFCAILSGTAVITGIVGVWLLNKVLGLSGPFILLLILSTCFVSSILISISKTPTGFYSAALLGTFIVLLSPIVKSEMSYVVPNADIGKVFAFTSTLEAVTPFAATPAYTEVYNTVLTYKPLYLYFLSSACWLLALILSLIILIVNCWKEDNYQSLQEIPENENESNSVNT